MAVTIHKRLSSWALAGAADQDLSVLASWGCGGCGTTTGEAGFIFILSSVGVVAWVLGSLESTIFLEDTGIQVGKSGAA